MIPSLSLSSPPGNTAVAATAVATADSIARGGTVIELGPTLYAIGAVALSLIGVYLARLVTVDAENKKLGRVQTLRETGPLTWIGVLIVAPIVWYMHIPIPLAAPMGLGVGYSVKVVLKILGSGAQGFARGLVKQAADSLAGDDAAAPTSATAPRLDAPGSRAPAVILAPDKLPADQARLIERLDGVPDVPGLPSPPKSE